MRAVTDSGPNEMNQQKPEAIENLFQLMKIVSNPDTVNFFDEHYNKCTIRYGDLKKQLAEDMVNFISPFREKILELSANDKYLHKVASLGRDKARESAAKTISDIRHIIGFREF